MKKINKKILIIISAIVLVLSLGIGVFAYFNMTKTQAITAESDVDTTKEQVFEIASFADLFRYSKAGAYNDENIVSAANTRKILKLTANIDLPVDLEITADVHINLNNKTLNLNDHLLTFRHGYAGCFNIFGGTISNGTNGDGKIIIDLPKASIITDFTGDDCVDISNIDAKYTAYMALVYVANGIGSDLDKKVKIENYETVSDSTFDITQDELYIYEKDSCKFNLDSSDIDICSFVYKDLDLPFHYLSSDIDITYTSSNENLLTNEGIFTAPDTTADLTLTATINHDSWDNSYSCTFKLHAVNLNDQTVKNNVAEQLIKSYLLNYYNDGDLIVNETMTLEDYYYGFNQGTELPLSALGGNITYSYSMTDYADENTVTTTSYVNNNVYVLEPNDNCYHLIVNINNNSKTLNLNMYSTYVSDYETIARLIINDMYGGSVVYDSSLSQLELNKISDLSTVLSENIYSYVTRYNITNVAYSLKSGSEAEAYYTCQNDVLAVIAGANPKVKSSYLTISFTFGSGVDATTVGVDVYIDYLAASGDTLAGFLKYYNIYDPKVNEEVPLSFEMPISFSGGTPYTCYDISYQYTKTTTTTYEENFTYYTYTLGIPDCLSVGLYYDGSIQYNFTSSTSSLTTQLDTYLSNNNNLSLQTLAAKSDAKYVFSLNVKKASAENLDLILIYNYKLKATDSWQQYNYSIVDNGVTTTYLTELNVSTFRVLGALFYDESSSAPNAIKDKYFFKWIYNNFNPNNATDTINDIEDIDENSYILVDWLSLDVALDVSKDDTLNSVKNFYGVGNLKSVTKVNLSGRDLNDPTVLASIATMESVTSLILSGCQITDITNICTMRTIKTLDLSNNNIQDFNGLVNIDDLIDVFVYGNNTDSTIYGSLGIINFQTYTDLVRDGISVYNQESNGIGVLYADSDDYNDYVRLKSIIYQDKLSSAYSIESLYTMYKKFTATDFGLSNTGGSFSWTYQTTDKDGNIYTAYTATYFQVTYTFGSSNYKLVCKYYVDRY